MKKVGIIGSGAVGQALAKGFIKHGYEVMIGTNSPAKYQDLKEKTDSKVQVGSFNDAAKFGDIVVLATKGSVSENVVKSLNSGYLTSKTVMDATNPIADVPPVNGVVQYFTSHEESLMERLQKIVPGAHFVKAFSSIGSAFMVNPNFKDVKPTMFYCGNHDASKSEVRAILEKFGFEPEDMGKVESARAIEPLAMLWCIPGFRENKWSHAFKLLKQ
jgi:8-hydroxy-5-deazaflavin:NADPH oxidoreductase